MGRIILVLLVIIAWSSVASAATYYTDKSGSDANSCATAATAASDRTKAKLTIIAGKNCLTTAGDTLIVGNGTYVEAEIQMNVSGTQANPITIRAENNLQAVLSSISNGVGCTPGVDCPCAPNISFYASWIVIDGIHGQIDPTDVSGCPLNSAQGAFVRMWSSNDPVMGGNESSGYQGGVVRNCQVDASSHRGVGIKTNQDYSLIENCTMGSSLEGFNGLNQVFRNNTIHTPDGWGDFFTCKGGARNCQFYNNVMTRSAGSRIMVIGGNSSCCWWDASTHYECYNCVAYNNVISIVSGTNLYGASFAGCKDCAMFNNVMVGSAWWYMEVGSQGGFPPQPWPDGSVFKNNITKGEAVQCTLSWSSGTNTTTNYNDFYNCTSPPTQTNAITGDPLFVNPASDWHLQSGSPAHNSGTTATMAAYGGGSIDVSLDRDGYARKVQWDLGIYEDDRGGGEPIMFISFAWLLFGIAVVAGGALVVNGVQILSGKVPGLYQAVMTQGRQLWNRMLLRFAWKAFTRTSSRSARTVRERRRPVPDQQVNDRADHRQ